MAVDVIHAADLLGKPTQIIRHNQSDHSTDNQRQPNLSPMPQPTRSNRVARMNMMEMKNEENGILTHAAQCAHSTSQTHDKIAKAPPP